MIPPISLSEPFWIFTISWWGGVFGAGMAELITRLWHAWLDRPRYSLTERRIRELKPLNSRRAR